MKYDVSILRSAFRNLYPFDIVPVHSNGGHFYQRSDTQRIASSVTTKLGFADKPYLRPWYIKKSLEYIKEHEADIALFGLDSVLESAKEAGNKSRDQSAGFGTTAHNSVERYLDKWIEEDCRPEVSVTHFLEELCKEASIKESREIIPANEEIAACRSFDKFFDENEIIPLASEIRIWYEKGNDCFAGTIDCLALLLKVRKGRIGDTTCKHDYEAQEGKRFWCVKCSREVDAKFVEADWKSSNSISKKDEYAHQTESYAVAIEVQTKIRFDDVLVVRVDKNRAHYEIQRVNNRKQAWNEFIAISRAYDGKHNRGDTSLLEPLTTKEVITI